MSFLIPNGPTIPGSINASSAFITTLNVETLNGGGSGGGGDVVGPGSSTDNAIVRFDGVTGTFIKDSTVTINNSGNIITDGGLTVQTDITSNTGGLIVETDIISNTGGLDVQTNIDTNNGHIKTKNGDVIAGGNVIVYKGLVIQASLNKSMGTVQLVSGTATVANTYVKTTDYIFLTVEKANVSASATTYEAPSSSIVNGTQFVINAIDHSTGLPDAGNTSIIRWLIIQLPPP